MITSPYNFVPLSEKVVMPFWAKQVSHDIPFKEAQSGTLKLKIKAESPIYVRNGVPRNASDNDKNRFNHFGDNCFIPGSSIRGMLRSVMEIMSFGRMGNKVNKHHYSQRDFNNKEIYQKETFSKEIHCGYLVYRDGNYLIKDCGKPGRIAQETLSKSFREHFSAKNKFDKNSNPEGWNPNSDFHKSAKYKYDKFNDLRKITEFKFVKDDNGRSIYETGGDKHGEIIFTGQPGFNDCKEVLNKKTGEIKVVCGKHYEFIFFENNSDFQPLSNDESRAQEIIDNFLFAYYDDDINSQKPDWKELRGPEFKEGEPIPIFFRKEKGSDRIKDIGLTFLYKITYDYSVEDSIKYIQKDANDYDLAETIFGYTNDKELSLKGRVHVGHAFVSNGKPTPLSLKTEVLAEPKASYYPNYIEQNPNAGGIINRYQTFMNSDAKIRGWKRYPIHNNSLELDTETEIEVPINEKMTTKFIPLPAETEFEFDIHYHNLRKEELGALISTITFHNTEGLFHSIGSAKPLGYGKISLSIEGGLSPEKQLEMMKAYEIFMDYSLENSTPLWFQSLQIKELMSMAKPGNNDKLKYMPLADFANKKGRGRNDPHYALLRYTVISGNSTTPAMLGSIDDIKKAIISYQKEKAVYDNLKTVEEVKTAFIATKKRELKELIEQEKDVLLKELNDRLLKLKIEEKVQQEAIAREESRAKAQSGLPDRWNKDSGFDRISRELSQWQKKLENNHIPEEFQVELFNLLKDVISSDLNDSRRKRSWQKPKDIEYRIIRIEIWIGSERAIALKKEFFE